VYDEGRNVFIVVAVGDIDPLQEIFLAYGADYWQLFQHRASLAAIRQNYGETGTMDFDPAPPGSDADDDEVMDYQQLQEHVERLEAAQDAELAAESALLERNRGRLAFAPCQEGARQEGARQEGARQEGARQEGARQEGARQDSDSDAELRRWCVTHHGEEVSALSDSFSEGTEVLSSKMGIRQVDEINSLQTSVLADREGEKPPSKRKRRRGSRNMITKKMKQQELEVFNSYSVQKRDGIIRRHVVDLHRNYVTLKVNGQRVKMESMKRQQARQHQRQTAKQLKQLKTK
jgi:hypothetical protein